MSILKSLKNSHHPVSVGELSRKLKNRVDTVTVYRALEDMADAGLVRRVDLQHPHAHYEYVDSTRHHHHLVCKMCGKVEDVESCEPKHLEERVLKKSKTFASIETHAMEFFGLCKECINS
jgi:Fe2+ or Zn2+ uptake regulation protein